MPHRGGVGDGAVDAGDRGIVGERVAVAAEQRAAGLLLGEVALGLDVPDVEIDRAALEVEARDHPVGVERDVVVEHRRVRVVGHRAEERAVDLGRDLAFDREVAHRDFGAAREVAADEMDGLWKGVHGPVLSPDSSWINANDCYNRREGRAALRALKGGDRVLKRTENDAAHSHKVVMLHQLLKLTNRLMAPFSTHLAHRYKISLNEFRLLMTIGALGRSASHELAELTGVNVMSVSRAVATLERHGRIEVVRDPANRRRKWLTLTEEGAAALCDHAAAEREGRGLPVLRARAGRGRAARDDPDPPDRHARGDGRGGPLAVPRADQARMTEDERRAIEPDCERLIKHYVNLNDAQDWPAVAALYTEDARFARPSQPGVFVEGREAILASFLARPARAQRHVIANMVVEVEDADHARAFSVIVLYMGDVPRGGRAAGAGPEVAADRHVHRQAGAHPRRVAFRRARRRARLPAVTEPKLLSGGNPQIAKGEGDAPVQAYIAAMPGWKSDLGRRLDALIERAVPGVRRRSSGTRRSTASRARAGSSASTASPGT